LVPHTAATAVDVSATELASVTANAASRHTTTELRLMRDRSCEHIADSSSEMTCCEEMLVRVPVPNQTP
jgi:hypothetical protein